MSAHHAPLQGCHRPDLAQALSSTDPLHSFTPCLQPAIRCRQAPRGGEGRHLCPWTNPVTKAPHNIHTNLTLSPRESSWAGAAPLSLTGLPGTSEYFSLPLPRCLPATSRQQMGGEEECLPIPDSPVRLCGAVPTHGCSPGLSVRSVYNHGVLCARVCARTQMPPFTASPLALPACSWHACGWQSSRGSVREEDACPCPTTNQGWPSQPAIWAVQGVHRACCEACRSTPTCWCQLVQAASMNPATKRQAYVLFTTDLTYTTYRKPLT